MVEIKKVAGNLQIEAGGSNMKKVLGLSIACLSIAGFSSLVNVNALEPAVASNFKNVDTKAKLRFSYNTESLIASNMQIKFGGLVKNEYFNAEAEHGVIVVPEAELNILTPENNLLAIEEFNKLNDKKYVLSFTNEQIADVEDKILGASKQYAWVINSTMAYDYGFAAVMYEKMGDVVTVAKPANHSLSSLIDAYCASETTTETIKTVLNGYRQAPVKTTVDTGFLWSNTPLYTTDGWYDLYVDAWDKNGVHTELLKTIQMDSNFEISLNRQYTNIQYYYIEKGKEGTKENAAFKSAAFKIEANNYLVNKDLVPINIDLEFIKNNLKTGAMPNLDNMVLYVKLDVEGAKNRNIRLEKDSDGNFKPLMLDKNYFYHNVKFIVKSLDQNPDDITQNVWAETRQIYAENGKLLVRPFIDESTLEYHLGHGNAWDVVPNDHDVVFKYTDSTNTLEPKEELHWFEDGIVGYILPEGYDTVQLIIQKKNGTDQYGHTDEFKIVDGAIVFPEYNVA